MKVRVQGESSEQDRRRWKGDDDEDRKRWEASFFEFGGDRIRIFSPSIYIEIFGSLRDVVGIKILRI